MHACEVSLLSFHLAHTEAPRRHLLTYDFSYGLYKLRVKLERKKQKRRKGNYCATILFRCCFFASLAYGSTVSKSQVRMSTPFCCICSTTFSYVRDTTCTLQLGLGHIWDAPGRGGGPILTDAVICPLRG
jgi:hypothetical protein